MTWAAKGEAGLVETTGNSKTTTITASANASRKDRDNKLEKLSLNASFTAKYDNFPAPLPKIGLPFAPGYEPAADKLDTITKLSLIFKFL